MFFSMTLLPERTGASEQDAELLRPSLPQRAGAQSFQHHFTVAWPHLLHDPAASAPLPTTALASSPPRHRASASWRPPGGSGTGAPWGSWRKGTTRPSLGRRRASGSVWPIAWRPRRAVRATNCGSKPSNPSSALSKKRSGSGAFPCAGRAKRRGNGPWLPGLQHEALGTGWRRTPQAQGRPPRVGLKKEKGSPFSRPHRLHETESLSPPTQIRLRKLF